MLAGSGAPDLRVSICGVALPMPVMVAPMAFHQLSRPADSGIATAPAASPATALRQHSSELQSQCGGCEHGAALVQLYCYKDHKKSPSLWWSGRNWGYGAIVLTADTPIVGRRKHDIRNRFTLPPGMGWKNAEQAGLRDLPRWRARPGRVCREPGGDKPDLANLDWLAQFAGLPVLVKGILRADDTHRAAEHGAAGVIVSNHGGRQLDTTLAAIDALPEVAAAARETADRRADGRGIRPGMDALKALALGPEAILVGRPVLWGLAVAARRARSRARNVAGSLRWPWRPPAARTTRDTRDLVAAP